MHSREDGEWMNEWRGNLREGTSFFFCQTGMSQALCDDDVFVLSRVDSTGNQARDKHSLALFANTNFLKIRTFRSWQIEASFSFYKE